VNRSTRLPQAVVLATAAVIVLSACAGGQDAAEQVASSPAASSSVSATAAGQPSAPSAEPSAAASASASASPSTVAATPAEPARPVSGAEMAGHIHTLAYDGRELLIGTHEGLWGQDAGETATQLSDDAFDVMGFSRAGDRWLASGHPGEGMDAPADLGLLESTDQGRTWTEVSLGGEVDFHRLVTSDGAILGISAHDGRLLRSEDGGTGWTDLGVPGLYDLAVSPTDPSVVVGTAENGPVRSTDGGATFEPIDGAPLIALLAWTGGTLFGADVDGQVVASTDEGVTWNVVGSLPAQPAAFTALGDTIAALVDDAVLESVDGGATFAPRITDLGGH
jgi:photosystem II stability/assembly factor-like uncharacterized protein